MLKKLRITAFVTTALLLAGCGCTGARVLPTTTAWSVGSTHVQPCASTQGWVDADGQFWALTGDHQVPGSDVGSCFELPAVTFSRDRNGNPQVWYQLIVQGKTLHTNLVNAATGGVPTPPSAYALSGFFAIPCAASLSSGVITLDNGLTLKPAAGETYPAGHPPSCSGYAQLTKVSAGHLTLVTPQGKRLELVPHRQSVSYPCG